MSRLFNMFKNPYLNFQNRLSSRVFTIFSPANQRLAPEDIPTPAQEHPETIDVDEGVGSTRPNAAKSWEMMDSNDPAHVPIDAPGRKDHHGIGDAEKGQEMEEKYFETHRREGNDAKNNQTNPSSDVADQKENGDYAIDDKGILRQRYFEREEVGVVEEEEDERMKGRGYQ